MPANLAGVETEFKFDGVGGTLEPFAIASLVVPGSSRPCFREDSSVRLAGLMLSGIPRRGNVNGA